MPTSSMGFRRKKIYAFHFGISRKKNALDLIPNIFLPPCQGTQAVVNDVDIVSIMDLFRNANLP